MPGSYTHLDVYKRQEFINEMNEADKSMDFINEPPTLTPPVLSDTLRMPKFDFTPVSYTHLDVYKRQV